MKCYLCKSEMKELFRLKPDEYQRIIDIHFGERIWFLCGCGLYQQESFMSQQQRDCIYKKYRSIELREDTIAETFNKIRMINPLESENEQRIKWLNERIYLNTKLLDVGSGLGVFPFRIKEMFPRANIACIEPCPESSAFINELGISCSTDVSLDGFDVDLVSCIHVLEHIADPGAFLQRIAKITNLLFVEVPSANEFDYLPYDHDEFNSLHLFFYNGESLSRMLEPHFEIIDLDEWYYESRKLSRLFVIARSKSDS